MIGWAWHTTSQTVLSLKIVWLNQQLSAMMHANKQALKFINKSNKHNQESNRRQGIGYIPIGNHVLLRDHLEGCNKIQNRFKSDVYIIVSHNKEPNVY